MAITDGPPGPDGSIAMRAIRCGGGGIADSEDVPGGAAWHANGRAGRARAPGCGREPGRLPAPDPASNPDVVG